MAVLKVKGRTTRSQQSFEACSQSSSSYIYTDAADSRVEEFSIELSLGEGWNDNYSNSNKTMRKIHDNITIQRHGSIVVEVSEEIRVPYNKYGILMPTGSLFLTRGVMVAPAKVEPAFSGKLKLRLFNTTSEKISLVKGDKLASIVFFATDSTVLRAPIYRVSEISEVPIRRWVLLLKWFAQNKITWIGWILSLLSSSIVAVGITYALYYKPMLELQNSTKSSNSEINRN